MKMSSDSLLRFSSTFNYFGLFLIFVLIGHCSTVYSLRTGASGVCTGVTSSVQTFQGMRVQAQRVQVSKLCGWNTCHTYKVVFVPVYFTATRTTYREQLVCCPGYTTRDNNISCEQFLVLGGPDPGPHSPGSSSNPSNPQNPNVIPGPETGPNVNGDPKVPTSNGPVPPVGPNNPGAGGPVVSPGNNNPVVPLPPNNPGNSGPGSSNGTIVSNGPSSPTGPGIPNEPVGPGRPTSGPGRSNGTLEPNNPILPGSPNNPTGTGPANEPVIPGSSPGNQNYPDRPPNQPIGPFNPNVDQHNPEVPSDPTNRGQSRPEVKPGQGRNTAGGLPNKDGIKRPDNAADDDAGNNANGGSHGPAESRGSVMLIFGILLVTMAIFTLTAIGISILKTRVNEHDELEDDQPRTSYSFSRWSRYWTGRFRAESFYLY
ncbi:uncharacterized protein [Apostichopus japonicus]|uniref:uncharacterized protein n=1 Tax=Stichopus japonicus TaxID=307972 RepID=UPI003AB4B520